jgi:hypothetical protein
MFDFNVIPTGATLSTLTQSTTSSTRRHQSTCATQNWHTPPL